MNLEAIFCYEMKHKNREVTFQYLAVNKLFIEQIIRIKNNPYRAYFILYFNIPSSYFLLYIQYIVCILL